MTSTTAASTAHEDPVPGLVDTAVPAEPSPSTGSRPLRRRSRFPGAEPQAPHTPAQDHSGDTLESRPRVAWLGPAGPLREQVRDHATAVGAELCESGAPGAVHCTVADAAALTGGARVTGGDRRPLLVVTDAEEIPQDLWPRALECGARAVLPLPARSEELLSRLADLARPRTSTLMLGVAGGSGGAGASSFAARLAAAARAHGPVTLLDADPLGGGLDLLVEAPTADGICWSEAGTLGPDDGEALREGLPRVDEVALLTARDDAAPSPEQLVRALTALSPLGGIVIVDLGAELVPAAAELLDQLLVVVPSSDHAVRAAARRLRTWQLPADLAQVVVRRRGDLVPREVAEDLALPLAGAFRDSARGTVPLLDVRRRGADRTARDLLSAVLSEARA
ncbi:MAG TPA: hypothetical protein K8V81_12325 [Brachybacterium massiliense]|uniref:Rv3660c-like CheY-like N-terminal domain-containing protein n=1 Tax=Brachybacterium massiliense TaxID=1755098 RepID=A0A921SYQ2_9MICO|nr:hypothetical protein [Brachybacterium massiliense]